MGFGHSKAQRDAGVSCGDGWRMFRDDNGQAYYYNERTGQTQWDPPNNVTPQPNPTKQGREAPRKASQQPTSGGRGDWKAYKDDHGETYYFNDKTGESRWDLPPEAAKSRGDAPRKASQMPTAGGRGDWKAYKDDRGETYYFNDKTGESRWDLPPEQGSLKQKGDAPRKASQVPTSGGKGDWKAYKDDHGETYYFNDKTGESRWELPAEAKGEAPRKASAVPAAGGMGDWKAYKDDKGETYYFNDKTGESRWELPADVKAAANKKGDAPRKASAVPAAGGKGDWKAYKDDKGETYYFNDKTGESRWDLPADAAAAKTGKDKGEAPRKASTVPAAGGRGDWKAYKDDKGETYYFNDKTGESRWDLPPEQGSLKAKESTTAKPAQAAAATTKTSDWKEHKDDKGDVYYFNDKTGESRWDAPPELAAEKAKSSKGDAPRKASAVPAPGGKGDWKAYKDEQGDTYYFNDKTGESRWDLPPETRKANSSTASKGEAPRKASAVPAAGGKGDWKAYKDDHGDTYYFNDKTGESRWDLPPELAAASSKKTEAPRKASAVPAPGGVGDWKAYKDDKGDTYYFNDKTGESRWDLPPELAKKDAKQEAKKDAKQEAKGDAPKRASMSPTSGGKGDWKAYKDDKGDTYYFNDKTGESRWDLPTDADATAKKGEAPRKASAVPAPGGKGDWKAYKDDKGDTYYFNDKTGESRWDMPESQ